MTKLLLRDVGDGLNLLIRNNNYFDLTVDFGGDKNLECYYCFNDSFLLTHFHSDHYKGILNCQEHRCCWHLDKFYHPIMPSFKNNKILFMSLLAMNIRISNKHPIQNTILSVVSKLNQKPLKFITVAKGDVFVCGKRKYEILWPPQELKEEETLKVIRTAIEDFEKAKEKDISLQKIYYQIYKHYADSDINTITENDLNYISSKSENTDELSEIIKKANDSLRKAANRLSVAFRQDDNILFLGDLEKTEIDFVVNELILKDDTNFDIVISSHHGTHWSNSLNSINADICLASVGERLRNHIKFDYLTNCNKFIRTDELGDIKISQKLRIK